MTREEAIQWLEAMKSAYALPIETYEAIDMAIEALSQPIVCKDYRIDDDHIYCSPKMADRVVEALSADAVQGEWIEKYNGNGWNDFWDYTCSNCGKKYERADAVLYHANYCPNCGARMKGGAE